MIRKLFFTTPCCTMEIQELVDASSTAHGAHLYVKITNQNNTHSSKLIRTKSKVALLKTISLARLELCAAEILARLANKIILKLKYNKLLFANLANVVPPRN